MKLIYCINGWRKGKSYFMSFGFSQNEIDSMVDGEVIKRGSNEFSIEVVE